MDLHFRIRDLKLSKLDKLVVTFFTGRVKVYDIIGYTDPVRINKLYHYAPEHLLDSLIQVDADRGILLTAMKRYWMHTFCLETGTVLKSQMIPDKILLSIHMCFPYAVLVCFAHQGDMIELWDVASMVLLGKLLKSQKLKGNVPKLFFAGKFTTGNRILAVGLNLKRIVLFTPNGNFVLNYAKELASQGTTAPIYFTQMYGPVSCGGLHNKDIYIDDKVAIYHDKFQCYVRIVDYSNGLLRNRR